MNLTTTPSPSPTRNIDTPIEPSFFPTSSPTEHLGDDNFNYILPALLIGIVTIGSLGFCCIGGDLVKEAAGHNIFTSD